MIETRRLKNVVIFIQTILSFVLSRVTKTIENETKKQKGGFLSTLLGTLGATLLGNLLKG